MSQFLYIGIFLYFVLQGLQTSMFGDDWIFIGSHVHKLYSYFSQISAFFFNLLPRVSLCSTLLLHCSVLPPCNLIISFLYVYIILFCIKNQYSISGGIRSTIKTRWTAGQQVERAILHQLGAKFITHFISLEQVVPDPV